MAENESLDLGGAYAKRWDVPFGFVSKGASSKEVVRKVESALYSGLRKTVKQLQQEYGVSLSDLLDRLSRSRRRSTCWDSFSNRPRRRKQLLSLRPSTWPIAERSDRPAGTIPRRMDGHRLTCSTEWKRMGEVARPATTARAT